MTIDRASLNSGDYLKSFKDLPGFECWSPEQIEASMLETLARRPSEEPVWLFAYGSLIWNPQFHFVESTPALLADWRRSFCMRLIAGRGCIKQPGRMLSLAPGDHTRGLALRLDEATLMEELRMVWIREMVGGSYLPQWTRLTLDDGRSVSSIVFTANPQSSLHEPDDGIDTVAPLIASANGVLGSNRDYVMQLDKALRTHGFQDDYIHTLAAKLADIPSLNSLETSA